VDAERLAEIARPKLLLETRELAARVGAEPRKPTIVLEDWEHPSAAGGRPSAPPDIVNMCGALAEGRAPRRKGRANGEARTWLAALASLRPATLPRPRAVRVKVEIMRAFVRLRSGAT
jgi:hypothetical protein